MRQALTLDLNDEKPSVVKRGVARSPANTRNIFLPFAFRSLRFGRFTSGVEVCATLIILLRFFQPSFSKPLPRSECLYSCTDPAYEAIESSQQSGLLFAYQCRRPLSGSAYLR